MPIKISNSNFKNSVLVAKTSDLGVLIEKASAKLGFKVSKLIRASDSVVVDDNEVLEDLLQTNTEELHLLALKLDEIVDESRVSKGESNDKNILDTLTSNGKKNGRKNDDSDSEHLKTIETISSRKYFDEKDNSKKLDLQNEIDKTSFNWSLTTFKRFKAKLLTPLFKGSMRDIQNFSVEYNFEHVEVLLNPIPFAKGCLRHAYAATVVTLNGYDKYVAKTSLINDLKANTFDYNKDLIEIQMTARFLANEFNKISKSEKIINFIEVSLLDVNGVYFTLERHIPGTFKKWSNNLGEINETDYACTVDAFSHWTYHVSDGYFLVTDLQGFVTDNFDYLLTDPAIQCEDTEKYSNTNLEKLGIKTYFMQHRCNHICKELNLSRHLDQLLPDRSLTFGTKLRKND